MERRKHWHRRGFASMVVAGWLLGMGFPCTGQIDLDYSGNRTVTWEEAIRMYAWLDANYSEARLVEAGMTDAGKPLHLFIISRDGRFSPAEVHASGRTVLFINNGIHPGEPCGVDASIELAAGLLSGSDPYASYLDSTVVVIVPLFNVGGALNRGKYHRANQNGPLEHGFRGNARNLDLNRDFIKLDSRNTRSLSTLLREWEPDLFVDTHTSDGADYPYVITLINSHEQRHEASQAHFLEETVKPFLFEAMHNTPYEMSPYVWSIGRSPEQGIVGFMDYPRYTSGYASLYNTLSFTVETHMFKPFEDRVRSTWYLLREFLRLAGTRGGEIREAKVRAWEEKLARRDFVLEWALDTSRYDLLPFRGYAAKTRPSKVTGHERLYYDREDPWEREIPYYRYFKAVVSAEIPGYYILPAAWGEVVERLKINRVEMKPLERDTVMEVEVSYILDYQTAERPYNGHYYHYDVKTRKEVQSIAFMAGDYLIPTRQEAIEYLAQTLEPEGHDSFFNWNFFDGILFRNEYFSPYIFEDIAEQLLEADPELETAFRQKQQEDPDFAEHPYLQLRYIYERSPWSEASYMRYPVCRWSP
jgi:murein tripeptide amidase MpaA